MKKHLSRLVFVTVVILLPLIMAGTVGAEEPCPLIDPITVEPLPEVEGNEVIVFTRGSSHQANDTEIYKIKPDGSGLTRLTNDNYPDWNPKITPDGSKVTFCSKRPEGFRPFIMDIDGGNVTKIADNFHCSGRLYGMSPDSTQIVMSSGLQLHTIEIATGNISPVPESVSGAADSDWSPDGSMFAYGADPWVLYVQNTDGSNRKVLSTRQPRGPEWSPNGSRIAYESYMGHLRIVNSDGSNDIGISTARAAFGPSWSPDGSQIAYATLYGGQLRIINADGTGDHVVPNVPGGWIDGVDWRIEAANRPPVADAGDPYVVSEGESASLDGSGSYDPDPGDTLTYEWDLDYGGTTFDVDATGVQPMVSFPDNFAARTIALRVTDPGGLWGLDDSITLQANNVAPEVGPISVPVDPVQVYTQISASAVFTDPGADTHTAAWDWGDGGEPSVVEIDDGSRSVSAGHSYAEAGVYTVGLAVTDDDGGGDETVCQFVVVYDPEGGFVTGGGWIDSPPGACNFGACTQDTTGKANFGFVSKYKKGADLPTGNTEFQFKAGDLNFHSSSYQWLVVAGPKAQFKGDGTINNAGNYGFMLTALDAELTPSAQADRFRIKIWDKDNGDNIVYDNQMGDADDAEASTQIGGGSIVIHTKK